MWNFSMDNYFNIYRVYFIFTNRIAFIEFEIYFLISVSYQPNPHPLMYNPKNEKLNGAHFSFIMHLYISTIKAKSSEKKKVFTWYT